MYFFHAMLAWVVDFCLDIELLAYHIRSTFWKSWKPC